MIEPLKPTPLPPRPTFQDLVFHSHGDELEGHMHALHTLPNGGIVSVTIGGRNMGEGGAPYEMMAPDGEIHAPLTEADVSRLLNTMVTA